jgi:DNA topoisomerase-1
LFDYIGEDGEPHPIHSDDVNGYLRAVAGDDFSAKDFRTWEATVRCAVALAAVHVEGTVAAKAAVNDAVKAVAEQLGNTPAVCRKSYIHPGVIDEFVAHGRLDLAVKAVSRRPYALDRHEAGVVALVQRIAARQAQPLGELLAKSVRAARRKHAKPAKTGRG